MASGRRSTASPPLDASRSRFIRDLALVPAKARRLTHPEQVQVPRSEALQELTARTRDEATRRAGA